MNRNGKYIGIVLAGAAAVAVMIGLMRSAPIAGDAAFPEVFNAVTVTATASPAPVDRAEVVIGVMQSVTVSDDATLSGTFDTVMVTASGTADDYIEVNADAERGAKMTCLVIEGDYVRVSGVEVAGCYSHGIYVTGKHAIVENSTVHDNVTENGTGTCIGSGQWGSGIKLGLGGDYAIIRNNQVYENCGEGIAVTRARFALILENTARDNFSVNIYVDNSPYAAVRNNHVLCTGMAGYMRNGGRPSGIALGEEYYEGWGAQLHHNTIAGNYVDGCSNGIVSYKTDVDGRLKDTIISGNTINSGSGRSINLTGANENVLVENNRIYDEILVSDPAGVTLSNNTVAPPFARTATPTQIYTPTSP